MKETFCPASMCPLIAPTGSPWTKEFNVHCSKEKCGWFDSEAKKCQGSVAAEMQVTEVMETGRTLQVANGHFHNRKPLEYSCARAIECQWQIESGDKLCPPRLALSLGKEPRICLY